jgi:hypothetical protein
MSTTLLTVLVIVPTTLVIVALFLVLWSECRTARQSLVAVTTGIVLLVWAIVAGTVAARGYLRPASAESAPPAGLVLAIAFTVMALSLIFSRTLRSLLTNQRNLIWMNVWRLEGIVFLVLMVNGQMPALWALPSGIGDIIVGITAPWVASKVDTPAGKRPAIVFNLFGMLDLIVAVGLGIMTNPGRLQVFHTTTSSTLVTDFPLALVPTFLVPLAFALHIISLWQLLGAQWSNQTNLDHSVSTTKTLV